MNNEKTEELQEESWFETIRKIRDYSEEQFDKLIVYLNSGALLITVGFVSNIVDISQTTKTGLLIWSWVLFTVSLLSILISHRTAIIAMNFELKDKGKASRLCDIITQILNWFSLFLFIGGVAIFLIFVSKSI